MFEHRIWTMIMLSSLIAAPAMWIINSGSVMPTDEVRGGPAMYSLASVNSTDTDAIASRGFATAEPRISDPKNGSDFPVSGRFQFARDAAPQVVSDPRGARRP
jgi:hypothetical protein